MPADTFRRTRRGSTLIELLMVTVISAVTLATAVAIFAAMLNQRRRGERTIESYNAINMAAATIEFDVANAGYRFPAGTFAVRIINNVNGGTSLWADGMGGGGAITTTNNCGLPNWGLVPGADVIELAEGSQLENPGVVQSNTGYASFVMNATNPIDSYVAPPVILFAQGGVACLAQVTSAGPVLPNSTINMTMLGPDFLPDGAPGTRYPSCPAGPTPLGDMKVYRLGMRTRYMLCQPVPAIPTQRPVLFRQQSPGDGTGLLGAAQRIQDGLADLQFGVRLRDPTATLAGGAASDCLLTGTTEFCYCNVKTTQCTGADLNGQTLPASGDFAANANIVDDKTYTQSLRAVVVGITSVSNRPVALGLEGEDLQFRRPALLDHIAATGLGDGNLYLSQQHSITLNNLTLVSP